MKALCAVTAVLALASPAAYGQPSESAGLGEVVVSATRINIRYFQQDRPVIGLRRQADGAVMPIAISSDTREEATRKREIYAVLLAMLDRAGPAGFELVSGASQLTTVTRANYLELPFQYGGRVDTSKIELMLKTKLAGSAVATEKRLGDFIKSIQGSGRGVIDKSGGLTLTIVNPDQYRDAVITLVAQDAKHNAGLFGPDFTFNISGIDGQVAWSQVSSTEVFLYVPYRYTIVPK